VRRGGRAPWMGPGGAAPPASAVVTAAAVLTAGCGQVPRETCRRGAGPPPRRDGSPPAAAGGLPVSGEGPCGETSGPAGVAVWRPGGGAAGAPPQQLPQPSIPSGGTHRAGVHGLFLLRQLMGTVQSFLEAHVPTGMRLSGYGQSADPGGATSGQGRTADPGVTEEYVSFQPRSLPGGIYLAELDTAVVPGADGGSILRADAAVTWYPHWSAAEHVDPRRDRAVRIWVQLLSPRTHTVVRTVTSGAVIGRLATLVNGLPAAPYQPPGCPAIVATFRLTFVPAVRAAPRVVVSPSGCMTVGITVGGVAQPMLWGDERLIKLAMRPLRLRSLV
jgi:hypothetical protein